MSVYLDKSGMWVAVLPNGKEVRGFSKSSVIETAERYLASRNR